MKHFIFMATSAAGLVTPIPKILETSDVSAVHGFVHMVAAAFADDYPEVKKAECNGDREVLLFDDAGNLHTTITAIEAEGFVAEPEDPMMDPMMALIHKLLVDEKGAAIVVSAENLHKLSSEAQAVLRMMMSDPQVPAELREKLASMFAANPQSASSLH